MQQRLSDRLTSWARVGKHAISNTNGTKSSFIMIKIL